MLTNRFYSRKIPQLDIYIVVFSLNAYTHTGLNFEIFADKVSLLFIWKNLLNIRVVQNPTFLSNSKIDGSHKIFSLSMSKALEKNVFFENWCMFKIGSRALKFQKISRTRNVDFWLFEPP